MSFLRRRAERPWEGRDQQQEGPNANLLLGKGQTETGTGARQTSPLVEAGFPVYRPVGLVKKNQWLSPFEVK